MCEGGRAFSSEQTFSCTKTFLSFLHVPQTNWSIKLVLRLPEQKQFFGPLQKNVQSPHSHIFWYFYKYKKVYHVNFLLTKES